MAIFPLWGVWPLQNSVHHKAYSKGCVAYHHLIQANLVEQLEDLDPVAAILAKNVQLAAGELLFGHLYYFCIDL